MFEDFKEKMGKMNKQMGNLNRIRKSNGSEKYRVSNEKFSGCIK